MSCCSADTLKGQAKNPGFLLKKKVEFSESSSPSKEFSKGSVFSHLKVCLHADERPKHPEKAPSLKIRTHCTYGQGLTVVEVMSWKPFFLPSVTIAMFIMFTMLPINLSLCFAGQTPHPSVSSPLFTIHPPSLIPSFFSPLIGCFICWKMEDMEECGPSSPSPCFSAFGWLLSAMYFVFFLSLFPDIILC